MRHPITVTVASCGFVGLLLTSACGGTPNAAPGMTVALAPAPPEKAAATTTEESKQNIAAAPEAKQEAPVLASIDVKNTPQVGPSCDGRPGATTDCQGMSCCERLPVPAGITAYRRDGNAAVESRAIHAFMLDRFEVTVGRFRAWVDAGQPAPKEGDILFDNGAGEVVRWSKNAKVQDEKHLAGWKRYDTWTAGVENRPKNFVSWYSAAAFCAWDGGRLPTDAEWVYAAKGGEEDRAYPWGNENPTPEHAVFNCMGDGTAACALEDILPVGSKAKGIARWGHYDLAGSMFEWTLKGTVAATTSEPAEKARGGGFCYIGGVDRRANTELRPAVFRQESPDTVSHMTGFRCAYDNIAEKPLATAAK